MALTAPDRAFALSGPLPTGVTVLEASAGTGKTYTIAGLATRYVAEGVPLERLLLVTFTRMATGELRDRVRERLGAAEQGLARVLAGGSPRDPDEVVALLSTGSPEAVAQRHTRLARALAEFDAATIATTHGFCQEVLGGLGIAGDLERDVTFVEDVDDLVEEVVDDLYVRRFRLHAPAFDRAQARAIAKMAIENPAAPVEPELAGEDTIAAMRRRLALVAREELERRKRDRAVMTYDDLLSRLHATLTDPGGGPAATKRLRERFDVVLVDEFQDTDPVQWDIVRLAFGDGATTLVLIGDPKQAIYAFRGADVYAYLEAAKVAGTRATLGVNWRSDQGLLDAYDALLGGARLGHEGIVHRTVRAAEANQAPRLHGAPIAVPLRVRVVHRDEPSIACTPTGFATKPSAREHVAADLAADLVALLASGAEVATRPPGSPGRERVRPGHVAVLVPTNRSAALVRDALALAGVPAVINGAGSVFATDSARDWRRLLEAIERPTSSPRARAAALTPFLGWSAAAVACAEEPAWEAVHRRLHRWARILRVRGVASLTEAITLVEGLPGRVLAVEDGERRLTDLRHVAQLLHAAATEEHLGTTALTAWLRRRIAEADRDLGNEERSRRLESDDEAVQVLTVHRSKGLEFPIVYLPSLWDAKYVPNDAMPVVFHDAARGDRRTIDVALEGADFARHRRRALDEQRGEDLRLAYVALTRAAHQAVVWWAGAYDSRDSALGRLLFARDEEGNVAAAGPRTPSDADAVARFQALAERAPGCVSVERSSLRPAPPWAGERQAPGLLAAASFGRGVDLGWRRTSYSDLSARAHETQVASEPEESVVTDEPGATGAPGGDDPAASPLSAVALPLAGMPAGVHVGTFVHRVLEATDFAAADLGAELAAQVATAQARRQVDIGDVGAAVAGLRAAIETPLGPPVGGLRLCDVAREDRLDELEFELPLVGGDDAEGGATLSPTALGAVLREHLGAQDPLAAYADRLADPALRPSVRGYLTGSLDLVIRLPDPGGGPRFAVIDYKTNRLAARDEPLTAWHYRPAALQAEMQRAHYGLQALLYTVALHRYLRWRLPGYDPRRHVAGVLYLFLRGMTGAQGPTVGGVPCGVFAWAPPGDLVEALSDVLDRGGA